MRPWAILAALGLASPALASAAVGGLDVDTALIRLVLALLACGAVDVALRAWWAAQPASTGEVGGDDEGPDGGPAEGRGRVPVGAAGPPPGRRRTDRPAAPPRR